MNSDTCMIRTRVSICIRREEIAKARTNSKTKANLKPKKSQRQRSVQEEKKPGRRERKKIKKERS